ncbi:Lysosome membrane protein 2-like protein [Dinothrombium tinctorium]|uniref:Lysosome membrane protein 2-like protein n=1 Tax=Dinothrombium tinctorium TaxID=1965070 RepID=A0A3S3RVV2_9ACAR|nr:Lysosome membrane protein 2-like protein [Dinothrombium tinctorium]
MAKLIKCCSIVSIVFGVILIIVSIVGLTLFPKLVSNKVKEKIVLRKDSDSFKRWTKLSVPVFIKFYLFDIQNKNDVFNGHKPIVVERGPYVFRQTREKLDIEIDELNATITYKELKGYYFEPELSNGSLSDELTVVDVPVASLINKVSGSLLGSFGVSSLNEILKAVEQTAFNTYTVEEIIYGHPIPVLQKLDEQLSWFGVQFLSKVPKKFGLLHEKNLTASDSLTVNSGIHDVNDLQKVIKWNNEKKVSFWNSDYCNMINGTDGSRFHPDVKPDDVLYVFNPALCRSVSLTFDTKTKVENIETLRFQLPEKFFASRRRETDNNCFCTKEKTTCDYDGLLDISKCRNDAPILISAPHFLYGDIKLIDSINGLQPNELYHKTFVDVEPLTGAVLNAARRMQINVHIKSNENIQ